MIKRLTYRQITERANITNTVKKWRRRGIITFKETVALIQMIQGGDEEMYNLAKTIINNKKCKKNDKGK